MKRMLMLLLVVFIGASSQVYATEIFDEEAIIVEFDTQTTIIDGEEVVEIEDEPFSIDDGDLYLEIEDEPIPYGLDQPEEGDIFIFDSDENTENTTEEITLDEPIFTTATQPQTGGIPLWIYFMAGGIIITAGFLLLRKK